MKTTYTITGKDAIRIAARDGLTLRSQIFAGDARIVTPEEALEIAKEDPSLIYVTVVAKGWTAPDPRDCAPDVVEGFHVDDYFEKNGAYKGPDCDGAEPTFEDAPQMEQLLRDFATDEAQDVSHGIFEEVIQAADDVASGDLSEEEASELFAQFKAAFKCCQKLKRDVATPSDPIRHFADIHRQGKLSGICASTGEQSAVNLGAMLDNVLTELGKIDAQGQQGFCELLTAACDGFTSQQEVKKLLFR